jgi:hypothetical protein
MRHMRRQRTVSAAVLASAVLAISGTVVPAAVAGAAAVAGPASAHPASSGVLGPAASAASPRPVFLINGDRLLARPDRSGGLTVSLLSSDARGYGVIGLRLGSLTSTIPVDAVPYLGRGLDPRLFDPTALERAEAGGRLPVRVSFDGSRPVLPGVTITRSGAGSAQGYLTASSAPVFGAALARQFRADHSRASYGTDGLFGGGVNISLAGAAAPARRVARPDFPMHTVTVAGTDLAGRRDNGDVAWLLNAADWENFGDPIESINFFYHGTAKFSVPAGYYWAIGDFLNFTGTGGSERLAFLPQFKVTGNTTVHVAERAARSEITMVTPRPGVNQGVNFLVVRGGLHHTSQSITWIDSGLSLWVSPTTRKPTVGTLLSFASEQLTSPAKASGTPYVYNLDYAGPDGIIPAKQRYVARPANLATVNERYYQDVRTTGYSLALGGTARQLTEGLVVGQDLPLNLPGRQIQYFSAGQAQVWNSSYAEFSPASYFPWGGQSDDSFRALPAGRQQTVEWNRFPLHPQPYVSPGGLGGRISPLMPSAVKVGNTLYLSTTPFSDNQPEHVGAGFAAGPGATVSGSYEIDQNGVRIASGNAVNGIPAVRLRPKPSVIRFTLNAARTGRFLFSTGSQTVWTWRSGRQPQVRLPADWLCGIVIVRNGYRLVPRCAVQPMMTLNYQVRGMALNGTVAPGAQVIDLSVGHIQPAKALAIARAGAQVSYNDGQSWLPASVIRLGGGRFRITFTAPAGVDPTLRVTATDSAGGSIRETILRAYGVRL